MHQSQVSRRGTRLAGFCGAYASLGGLVILTGWLSDVPRLADWTGTGITTLPNAAMAAVLLGMAIVLGAVGRPIAAIMCASASGLAGAATLFEHVSGVSLGIDGLLLVQEWGLKATVAPGRMGPPASFSFALLGGCVAAYCLWPRARFMASVGGLAAIGVGMLSIVGYLYGTDQLFALPRVTAIAFPTSTIVVAAGLGCWALANRNSVDGLFATGSAALATRRLLPVVLLLPIVLGWLRVTGERMELFDSAFGAALRSVAEVVLLTALLLWTMRSVRGHERALASAQSEVGRQRGQLSAFLETAVVGLHRTASDGTILWANKAELALLGYLQEEYVGRNIREFHADARVIEGVLDRVRRGETVRDVEARVRCRNGELKTVLMDCTGLWDDGVFVHSQCFTRDITEQRRAETIQARLAAIVRSSDDAIVSKTLDGIITSWNRGAERIFGYLEAEVIGRPITLIIPPDRWGEEEQVLAKLRKGESIEHFETVRQAKDGRRVDISLTVSPMISPTGQVIGASKVARDVTQRRESERELERYRERLEQLVVERTIELEESHRRLRLSERLSSLGTLAAGLGHDLGNILMPIRMWLETLDQSRLSEQERESVAGVMQSAEYLRNLAIGLRSLAMDPEAESGPVTETALDAWWGQMRGVCRAALPRGVTLHEPVLAGYPTVAVSHQALSQAVFNLVQNAGDALRERGGGNVWLQAKASGRRVELAVRDDGPGMSPEVVQRCMEPFFTTKAKGRGTGLGLAIVQSVLARWDATIEVTSAPGAGATFKVSLPIAPGEPLDRASSPRPPATDRDLSVGEGLASLQVMYRGSGPG